MSNFGWNELSVLSIPLINFQPAKTIALGSLCWKLISCIRLLRAPYAAILTTSFSLFKSINWLNLQLILMSYFFPLIYSNLFS